ncbi:hypothetical protein SAY86_005642 [Trapa natans]|uniref:Translation initiation factor 5A C-terminal domain-containing protein n=1 Tax=Trapa natans TaxID=22666 RepID=A0AAN7L3S6_TRANT|nr:hypothetical protein SAY86_005642 [Trapa natans]
MSDEEHHFESKADAGASKTYPQQAGTIRKNGYIVIKNRPCKVVEVSTSKTGKHGHAKCHFVGIDIFNGKKLEDIVPSSHNCDVPHVTRIDYQLIDISEDGFVSLLTDSGGTKDDLRLPTDESLLAQTHWLFGRNPASYSIFRCRSKSRGGWQRLLLVNFINRMVFIPKDLFASISGKGRRRNSCEGRPCPP